LGISNGRRAARVIHGHLGYEMASVLAFRALERVYKEKGICHR